MPSSKAGCRRRAVALAHLDGEGWEREGREGAREGREGVKDWEEER